ncbi:bifunctional folylpolyglutamate synthase/dihydrofolate synthase [Canibacter zhuwentaonis]|uniref:bifunctional folylpolyglutamate synthase/dihydrofolate synthase n=1 Tax=Canibacter zhuwentaonis TaxID=2837491 RepID=UPI0020297E5B|nr:Mur ligase family protein [Canibacter zhuwentaonis]
MTEYERNSELARDPWQEATLAAGITPEQEQREAAEFEKLLNPFFEDDDDPSLVAPEQLADVPDPARIAAFAADTGDAAQAVYEQLLQRAGEANPRPRIEPVRRFAELAGMPQATYPIIQIAGTNGKTSTARLTEALLRAHGLRTGLFTSPHLVSFAERIQVNGEPVDGETLARAWQNLQPALQVVDSELAAAGQGSITFFEALVVLGYEIFADAPVEVAVVEVGLGGEWDATNIARAEVAVFTSIDLDHTDILGDNIASIAQTKSQIIDENAIAVSAQQSQQAQEVLAATAAQRGAELLSYGVDFEITSDVPAVGGRMMSVRVATDTYRELLLPLLGKHQSMNAATALTAVSAFFGRALETETVQTAFASVTSSGRLQLIGADPAVVVDAAHNPQGAKTLCAALQESFNLTGGVCFVAGVLAEKDALGVLREFARVADSLILVPVSSPRSLGFDELFAHAETLQLEFPNLQTQVVEYDTEGFAAAREWAQQGDDRTVVIAGSVVLAGTAIATAYTEKW